MTRLSPVLAALIALQACAPGPTDGAGPVQEAASPGGAAPGAGEDLSAAERAAQIEEGRAIAERECAICHGLDDSQPDPDTGAPPLSMLLVRYDQDVLANDLIEGIRLGHAEMPRFDFNVIAADALVAYLRTIRPARGAEDE